VRAARAARSARTRIQRTHAAALRLRRVACCRLQTRAVEVYPAPRAEFIFLSILLSEAAIRRASRFQRAACPPATRLS